MKGENRRLVSARRHICFGALSSCLRCAPSALRLERVLRIKGVLRGVAVTNELRHGERVYFFRVCVVYVARHQLIKRVSEKYIVYLSCNLSTLKTRWFRQILIILFYKNRLIIQINKIYMRN